MDEVRRKFIESSSKDRKIPLLILCKRRWYNPFVWIFALVVWVFPGVIRYPDENNL